jgi:hypothetical protein
MLDQLGWMMQLTLREHNPQTRFCYDAAMKALELVGDIDDQHCLQAQVPAELPAGPVRLIVLLPDEDHLGTAWAEGIAKEWAPELADPREDIYTLSDGHPVNAPR